MTIIKLRRGTAAQWMAANPVLASGEPGFETDTGKEKRGNGYSVWTSLEYFLPESKITTAINVGVAAVVSKIGADPGEVPIWDGVAGKYLPGPQSGGTGGGGVELPVAGVKMIEQFVYVNYDVARPLVPYYVSLNWSGPAGPQGVAPTNMADGDTWDLEV